MTAPAGVGGPAPTTVEEHVAAVLAAVSPLGSLDLVLADAQGTVLAQDVTAPLALPAWDQATIDGYAVQLGDVAGATRDAPRALPVVPGPPLGASAVSAGVAVRVAAGRPLPAAAEAVVPEAWTAAAGGGEMTPRIDVLRAPVSGAYLRRRGDDVAAGATVLAAGTQLGPVQVGLLASLGLVRAQVHPQPRVLVLATGDALLEVGERYEDGHAYDGVSHALAAACREAGALPYRLPTSRATVDALAGVLEDHLIQSDAVVIAADVRPTGYEPVLEVLQRLGHARVHRVAVDPGPVQVLGEIGADRVPVFVLPIGPVEALVSFELFVRPALRRMRGAATTARAQVRATVAGSFASPRGRRQYALGQVRHDPGRGYVAVPLAGGAPTLSALAAANALLVVAEATTRVESGTVLPALLLERRGG